MKITGISAYRTELPYVGGNYYWGACNVISTAIASVAIIRTDAEISGCGEFTPCGENYMVAQPMKLDECVTGMNVAQKIVADRGAEIHCLKLPNLGGLSKARRVRDYLVENRIPVVAEDTWGGEITTSVVAHFAASTPEEYLINSTDLMNYNTRSTGTRSTSLGGPTTRNGKLYASDIPGLGVEPDFESLGDPVAEFGERV